MKWSVALALVVSALLLPTAAFAVERPYVTFKLPTASPKAGRPIALTASGTTDLPLSWDLDGDGVYDDATGTTVRATFAAGQRRVGVRATDQFGRVATEVREFFVTTVNVMPTVTIDIGSGLVATGQQLHVTATGLDIDGAAPRVELDLDGDGSYEAGAAGDVTFATAGAHVVRARVTDDDGAVAHASATVGVYATPGVTIEAHRPTYTEDYPIAGEPAEVVARPSGYARYEYDLDGNGTYEEEHGATFTHSFSAGDHVIGVRATDSTGKVATSRASVHVETVSTLTALVPRHPALAYVGVPVTLSATYYSYTGDPVFTWDADGDGADDGSAHFDPLLANRSTSHITFTYAHPGTYEVHVRVDGQEAMRTIQVVDGPPVPPSFRTLHTWPVVSAERSTNFETEADDSATLTFDLDGDGDFDDLAAPKVYGWEHQFAHSATIAAKATAPDGGVAIRTADVSLIAGNLGPWVELTPFRRDRSDDEPLLFAHKDDPVYVKYETGEDDIDFCCNPAWDLDGDGVYDDGAMNLYLPDTPGVHEIGMRVQDTGGAYASVRRTFAVASTPPVAVITPSGTTVQASGYDREGTAITYAWDLDGDGAFDDATGPTATALAGEHLVGLRATDADGDIGLAYRSVTPIPPVVRALPQLPPFTFSVQPSTVRLGAWYTHGLLVNVHCSLACKASVSARVTAATARRLHVAPTIAHGSGRAGWVRVRLTSKAARALRHTRSLRVTLTATGTERGGRQASRTMTLTLRR